MDSLSPTQILVLAIVLPPAAAIYMCLLWTWRRALTRDDQPCGWEERR